MHPVHPLVRNAAPRLGVAAHAPSLRKRARSRLVRLHKRHQPAPRVTTAAKGPSAPAQAPATRPSPCQRPTDGVVEALGKGDSACVLSDRLPANDAKMRELLMDGRAERPQRAAAVEEDALQPRAAPLVEQLDKGHRVGRVDAAVGHLKRQRARKRPRLDGVAMAGELDDARRHVAHEVGDVVGEARRGAHLAHPARDAALHLHDLAHQLQRRDLLARAELRRRREEREHLDVLRLLGVLARLEDRLAQHLAQREPPVGLHLHHVLEQPPLRIREAHRPLDGLRHLVRPLGQLLLEAVELPILAVVQRPPAEDVAQDDRHRPHVDGRRRRHRRAVALGHDHLGRRVAHRACGGARDDLGAARLSIVKVDELPLALEHQKVLRLQVAVHKAALVHRRDDLQQPLGARARRELRQLARVAARAEEAELRVRVGDLHRECRLSRRTVDDDVVQLRRKLGADDPQHVCLVLRLLRGAARLERDRRVRAHVLRELHLVANQLVDLVAAVQQAAPRPADAAVRSGADGARRRVAPRLRLQLLELLGKLLGDQVERRTLVTVVRRLSMQRQVGLLEQHRAHLAVLARRRAVQRSAAAPGAHHHVRGRHHALVEQKPHE